MQKSLHSRIFLTLFLAAGFCFSLATPAMACTEPNSVGGAILLMGIYFFTAFPFVSLPLLMLVIWLFFKLVLKILEPSETESEQMT